MKKDPEVQEKSSRRDFTKSVAATLISAPIAAAIVSCQNQSPAPATPAAATSPSPAYSPSPQVTLSDKLPRRDECIKPSPATEDHIPPMIIGDGGSLRVELAHQLKDRPEPIHVPAGATPPVRKFRYIVTGTEEKYGNILSLQPVVEEKRYCDARSTYMLADQPNALKLWLQKWDSGNNKWKEPPPSETDDPHILVKGHGKSDVDPKYDSLVIEVDEKFTKKFLKHKVYRPHQHERPFGSSDDQARIYRWAIVDEKDVVIFKGSLVDEEPPSEGTAFWVRFHD